MKDAEANDVIHMRSDQRCVMDTFLINTPEKNTHVTRENKKHETNVNVEHKEKAKNTNIEKSELEERHQAIIDTIKKAAAKKKMKYMTQEITRKIKWTEKNAAAAAEAESTLVETVAQGTEGRSKKRSSKVDNQQLPQQHRKLKAHLLKL